MTRPRFASLTAGLLARKGEAEPAATPFADQLLTRVGMPAQEVRLSPMPRHTGFGHRQAAPTILPDVPSVFTDPLDDLPPPAPVLEPVRRIVALRPLPPAEPQAVPQPAADACGNCPSPEDAGKVYHVNLRLKRQRFIRLKLSAALLRKPVQDIVSEALDAWFDKMPDDVKGGCACLAGKE
jgi:hypothetical protein